MYKLFLTLRYLHKRHIVYIAIGAVMLCTAMVLVVMSIMGGWLDQVKNRARGLLGDLVVDNRYYQGFPLYEEFIDQIRNWPEVEQATPVIYSYGLVRFQRTGRVATVQIVGLKLEDTYAVNAFKQTLLYEKYYPGTTTLAPQKLPVIGVERSIRIGSPDAQAAELDINVTLPGAYQSALEAARAAHLASTGRVLEDTEYRDTGLNEILRERGKPTIPGEWTYDPDAESPALVEEELPGAILGRDLISDRKEDGKYVHFSRKGEKVTLTIVPMSDNAVLDNPVKIVFRLADDSRTGIYEIDSRQTYIDFDLLQRQLRMNATDRISPEDGAVVGRIPARCSQIQIKLRDGANADNTALRMTAAYQKLLTTTKTPLSPREADYVENVTVTTWQQTQQHIIGPVEKERVMMVIILGMISLVAVALELCILYMIVLQKTRDIGIVKAVGGSSTGVAAIWLIYGAAVGLVGGTLGTILGTVFVTNINDIQDLLIRINPAWRVWDMKVYSFDTIPSRIDPWDALTVFIIAILASSIGSLAAALRAGYSEPVQALGYE
ncbi:MAG: ABC transporter permease [Phycisphaerae bacterium]